MTDARNIQFKSPRILIATTLLIFFGAGLLFTLWPEIDLYTSALFYEGNRHFVLTGNPLGTIPRKFFQIFFVGFCALSLFGLLYSGFRRRRLLSLGVPHWAYLVACLIIGPGLLTNAILKENWGRARPDHTDHFGWTAKFTPALVPSSQCSRNCSFVSGESSTIFMVFFSLALLLAAYRTPLILGGILIGGLAGLVRIGMGGHFLSDVTFSGIFMLLVAGLLYWIILSNSPPANKPA